MAQTAVSTSTLVQASTGHSSDLLSQPTPNISCLRLAASTHVSCDIRVHKGPAAQLTMLSRSSCTALQRAALTAVGPICRLILGLPQMGCGHCTAALYSSTTCCLLLTWGHLRQAQGGPPLAARPSQDSTGTCSSTWGNVGWMVHSCEREQRHTRSTLDARQHTTEPRTAVDAVDAAHLHPSSAPQLLTWTMQNMTEVLCIKSHSLVLCLFTVVDAGDLWVL